MMHQDHYRSLLVLAVIAITFGLLPQSATAQSDNDLRRENQRLTTQLRESSRELEAARARIAELEQQVARLERALAATRGDRPDPSPTEQEVTIDESEPSASPRALFRTLVSDYQETVNGMEIGVEGDRSRAIYLRTLQRWQAGVTRKYRSQVQWHVRIENETPTRSGYDLRLRAVDPVSHAELGDSFDVSLPRGLARRYESMRDRGAATIFVLRGTLLPQVAINAERQQSGPFDNPRLIGPFAEFRFTVEPRSLLATGDEE